jgi:hypothetical protein
VCVLPGILGFVKSTHFSKIQNNMNKFFIIREIYYFKYFSQFNIQQTSRKFHSLSILFLLYIVSFYFEHTLCFIKVWDLK